MRLLIDDSLASAPVAEAIRAGLVEPGNEVVLVAGLHADQVGAGDAALIPSGEYGTLASSHTIEPGLAIVFDRLGPVALRTAVRPDGVEQTPVRLIDASSSAELLARATLDPFFGITPAGYFREEVADAEVVVVEGALALTPPEAGFSEDLAKAWYVLTSEAYVSHVLLSPVDLSAEAHATLRADAARLAEAAVEHRRAVRTRIVDVTGLERDGLTALHQATRWSLADSDRRALLMLLQLGNRLGEVGPYVKELRFAGEGN